MKVVHPRPGKLQIVKSRVGAGVQVAFMCAFFVVWYSLLFAVDRPPNYPSTLFMSLFWVAPLFSLPEILRQARVLTSGESFELTRETGLIERNGTHVARFTDVARIQIRTIGRSEGSDEYRLSIILKNDAKLRIHQSSNASEVTNIAEDLADILGVQITRKG